MLVTDKFVFLHLPRAGGTFVYDVVKKFFPSAREIGYGFETTRNVLTSVSADEIFEF
jgi:hypothetical protein